MILLPPRSRALALCSVAGLGLAFCGPQSNLLPRAAAQTVDGAPIVANPPVGDMAHTDAKGRHLAPHDTFYILNYVSAKTDKGVEGFVPGQEVHLVSVDRDKHMLTVTNGRAQVEVAPSQLTNDMEIAAMARQQDQAGQARINAYLQAETAAYQKYEKDQAIASANDIKEIKKEQAEEAQSVAVAQTASANQSAAVADGAVANVDSGYYNEGGYGYGSPYSYFYAGRAGRTGGRGARESAATKGTASSAGGTAANRGAAASGGSTAPAATGTAGSATAGAPAAGGGGATTGTAGSATAGAAGGGGKH